MCLYIVSQQPARLAGDLLEGEQGALDDGNGVSALGQGQVGAVDLDGVGPVFPGMFF